MVPLLDAQAAQTYRDGFNATEGRWNAKEGKHDTVPDMKTRLETLKSYMAYRHGMPLQRQLVIERSLKDRETELKEVAATPSGRTLLLKLGAISPEWLEKHLPGKVLESQ